MVEESFFILLLMQVLLGLDLAKASKCILLFIYLYLILHSDGNYDYAHIFYQAPAPYIVMAKIVFMNTRLSSLIFSVEKLPRNNETQRIPQ